MITFPLREAMCSGVMPFWRENRTSQGVHPPGESSCSLPYPSCPRPRPATAAELTAALSLFLGHFLPEEDFKTCIIVVNHGMLATPRSSRVSTLGKQASPTLQVSPL